MDLIGLGCVKVLIRSLEEAAETEKTEEQEAALGAAAAGGSTTLAPPSPSTATVAQPQPPLVSPPSSTLPAPASTSPSNSPTPPRRISSATVSSYPSSAAALAVSSSRMAAMPRSQSVPHGLGNGLCKGESKQKPKQAKKGGCKGMTGLAKAKHDLLTFVTAKHRRFSYVRSLSPLAHAYSCAFSLISSCLSHNHPNPPPLLLPNLFILLPPTLSPSCVRALL